MFPKYFESIFPQITAALFYAKKAVVFTHLHYAYNLCVL